MLDRVIVLIVDIGGMFGKGYSFNAMHQVITKIWSLNVVACKTLTKFLVKEKAINIANYIG